LGGLFEAIVPLPTQFKPNKFADNWAADYKIVMKKNEKKCKKNGGGNVWHLLTFRNSYFGWIRFCLKELWE
jgi:hypothetical protein